MEESTKAITFNRLPILGQSKVLYEEWKFAFEHWCKKYKITEEDRTEYLIAITVDTARSIVINSLNKAQPDKYEEILNNLKRRYKSSAPRNAKFYEISTMIIKKGEKVADFDIKFLDLVNQLQLANNESIIIPYYINAFRNWPRMYEHLLEEEPKSLKEAMDLTAKKEKIFNLLGDNKQKSKASTSKNLYNNNNKGTNNDNTNNNFRPFYNNIPNNNNNYFNRYSSLHTKTNNNNVPNNQNNKYNYNTNSNPFNNMKNKDDINKTIEQRKTNLKGTRYNNDELNEITKRLSELKINLCINCQRIGHVVEECPELLQENHLNQ